MAARDGKFTFLRMISKPEFPNMRGDPNDIDLTTKQLDDLVTYQLGLPNPRYLNAGSFFVAGLTDIKSTSEKIHKALLKANITSAPSSDGTNDPVITSAIGKNYRSQLSFISQYAQRKLVAMLFFWEEECNRWKMLDQEEARIISEMGQHARDNQELDLALKEVEVKRKLLPSQVRK